MAEIPIILADGPTRMALSGAIGTKAIPGINSKGRASTKQNIVQSTTTPRCSTTLESLFWPLAIHICSVSQPFAIGQIVCHYVLESLVCLWKIELAVHYFMHSCRWRQQHAPCTQRARPGSPTTRLALGLLLLLCGTHPIDIGINPPRWFFVSTRYIVAWFPVASSLFWEHDAAFQSKICFNFVETNSGFLSFWWLQYTCDKDNRIE